MFTPDRVFDASLLARDRAICRPDFKASWDGDGLTPELYPLLRAWARHDIGYFLGCSVALKARMEAVLDQPGMRRRDKMLTLLDATRVERISDVPVSIIASGDELRVIRRAVPLGLLTVYLGDLHANREFVIPIDDIRLLDMPATDLGIISTVAVGGTSGGG